MPNIVVALVVSCLTVLSAFVSGAQGQGFAIKPMTMQVNPRPNEKLEIPLDIYNTALDGPRQILLRLVELSEDETGSWQLVEPGSAAVSAGHPSSVAWTKLSASSMDVDPQTPATVTVTVEPPSNARGVYFAGIVAETPVPDSPVGVVVRTRFLIPLIVDIAGRTVRQKVSLSDVSIKYGATSADGPPTTTAYLGVANAGLTFSRVKGEIAVEARSGAQWRTITTAKFDERGVIPGVTLKLGSDLERRLPSGSYRLRASLFVDGRRVVPLTKVVELEGDPGAKVAYDSTLLMKPLSIDMKVVPGATRTSTLQIENTSADPVLIEVSAHTPVGLMGVQMGTTLGVDLSAEPWTKIVPSKFTLRPYGRQNVRVVADVPATDVSHANYYADLILVGKYADGQSAGETLSRIQLVNASLKSTIDGQIEKLSASQGEGSKVEIYADFVNTGDVDVLPTAKVAVVSPEGGVLATEDLTGDNGPLLPLGRRRFSSDLDLASIAPGDYDLIATIEIAGGKTITRKFVAAVRDEALSDSEGEKALARTMVVSDSARSGEISLGHEPADPLSQGTGG